MNLQSRSRSEKWRRQQDLELVAKHEYLDVLVGPAQATDPEQLDEATDEKQEKRECDGLIPWPTRQHTPSGAIE